MKKLLLSLLVATVALALLGGCSSKLAQIALQVHLVKIEKKTDGTFLASLEFTNPNVDPINLIKSTHQLTLNGLPAGVLDVAEPVGVPAQQRYLTAVVLKPSSATASIAGSVSYQLVSVLTLSIYDNDTEHYKTSSSGTVKVE